MGAYDGNGLFVRSYNWVQDKANDIDITASRADTEDDGFAAGLSNCVTRDGQGRMSADFVPATDLGAQLGSASLRWNGFNGKSANHILPQAAFKPSATNRTSTITPAADPDLTLPVASPGTYALELLLNITANSTSSQGLRFSLFTGGSVFSNTGFAKASWIVPVAGSVGASVPLTSSPTSTFATLTDVGATLGQFIHIKCGLLVSAVTGGFIQLYWAQNSSSANAVGIAAASYMTLQRID